MSRLIVVFFLSLIPLMGVTNTAEVDFSNTLEFRIRMIQHLALNPVIIKAVKRDLERPVRMIPIEEPVASDTDGELTSDESELQKVVQKTREIELEFDHELLLREFVTRNDFIKEVYLADESGAEVAVFPRQSGLIDESTRQAAITEGQGKVFVGPVTLDQNTRSISTYVSTPILDQEKEIGSMVVVLNLSGA